MIRITDSDRKLIHSIYSPPKGNSKDLIQKYFEDYGGVKAFPFARLALLEILKEIKVNSGDAVLLPSFVCRDVLSPFNHLKLKIYFYEVDESLKPIVLPRADVPIKVVLGVHYFGFENDLSALKGYCSKNNSILIVDNAHGFLSRNKTGKLLGTEEKWGIVSVRKSFPIPNGAILINSSTTDFNKTLIGKVSSPMVLRVKNALRPFVGIIPIFFLKMIVDLKRILRTFLKGSAIPISNLIDEQEPPTSCPAFDFESYLKKVDLENECKRRRALFYLATKILKDLPVKPIYDTLGPNEVPYVFPFLCSAENIQQVICWLKNHDLEVVKWPALPEVVVREHIKDFYDQVYMVKFLW